MEKQNLEDQGINRLILGLQGKSVDKFSRYLIDFENLDNISVEVGIFH